MDKTSLRRWQIAVLRDLLRQTTLDRAEVSTALQWAGIRWRSVSRVALGHSRGTSLPVTRKERRMAVAFAWMTLQMPATPAALRRSAGRTTLPRYQRAVRLTVLGLMDAAVGTPPRAPSSVHESAWPSYRASLPFPVVRHKGKTIVRRSLPLDPAFAPFVRVDPPLLAIEDPLRRSRLETGCEAC